MDVTILKSYYYDSHIEQHKKLNRVPVEIDMYESVINYTTNKALRLLHTLGIEYFNEVLTLLNFHSN